MSPDPEKLLTVAQASRRLPFSEASLRSRTARGQLRVYRPSPRVVYIRRHELVDYVEKGCPPRVEAEASNLTGGAGREC